MILQLLFIKLIKGFYFIESTASFLRGLYFDTSFILKQQSGSGMWR